MRFSVSHETLYRYSVPVSLAPHLLRLDPRLDGGRLLSRELFVEPAPVLRMEEFDAHGNALTRVEFGAPTAELRVDSRFVIDTVAPTLHSASAMAPLPVGLSAGRRTRRISRPAVVRPAVAELAQALASGQETRRWLSWNCSIAHCINASTTASRLSGEAQALDTNRAAAERCRDIAIVHRRVSLPQAAGSLRERLSCAAAPRPARATCTHGPRSACQNRLAGLGSVNGIPAGEATWLFAQRPTGQRACRSKAASLPMASP